MFRLWNKYPEATNRKCSETHMCFLKGCLESKINFVIQNGLNCTHGLTMMTCFVCKHHHSKLSVEMFFTLAGYSDWKHALPSFDEHQAASYHRLAMTYEVIMP